MLILIELQTLAVFNYRHWKIACRRKSNNQTTKDILTLLQRKVFTVLKPAKTYKTVRHKPYIPTSNSKTLILKWSTLLYTRVQISLQTIPTVSSELFLLLKLTLQVLPLVETIIIWLLIIAGITLVMLSAVTLMWTINQQQESLPEERRDSTDLRIPLNYGQYTTIRILPAIKKITSKTDLFS